MAQGKTESRTVIINNKPATTTTKTLPQVVVNGTLTAEDKELNPGVDTRFF
jgi:hypothetical protein